MWLDGQEFKITDLQRGYVELLPPEMTYPIYRTERRADFEHLLRRDERNQHITDYLEQNAAKHSAVATVPSEEPALSDEPVRSDKPVQPEEPVPSDEAKPWYTFLLTASGRAFRASRRRRKRLWRSSKRDARRARNFRITDEHLGEGGAKAKCRANIEAIRFFKYH